MTSILKAKKFAVICIFYANYRGSVDRGPEPQHKFGFGQSWRWRSEHIAYSLWSQPLNVAQKRGFVPSIPSIILRPEYGFHNSLILYTRPICYNHFTADWPFYIQALHVFLFLVSTHIVVLCFSISYLSVSVSFISAVIICISMHSRSIDILFFCG